jgi:hypothetical protein
MKPLVEFLKVKREENKEKTMNERLHEKVCFGLFPSAFLCFVILHQFTGFPRCLITPWLESSTF